MEPAEHWNAAYAGGDAGRSWYQQHADTSLRLIRGLAGTDAGVLDVGGGASVLVDDLLGAGFADITVLDVSSRALAIAERRLGGAGGRVRWIEADLLHWQPDRTYDVWHDRAVLHFLTDPADRIAYRKALLRATVPGTWAVIGVFGPQGPTHCSGLPVQRYDRESLAAVLGDEFAVTESFAEVHVTPSGATQQFVWAAARRQ